MAVENIPEREQAVHVPPLRERLDGEEMTIAGQTYRILSESTVDVVTQGGKRVIQGVRMASVTTL